MAIRKHLVPHPFPSNLAPRCVCVRERACACVRVCVCEPQSGGEWEGFLLEQSFNLFQQRGSGRVSLEKRAPSLGSVSISKRSSFGGDQLRIYLKKLPAADTISIAVMVEFDTSCVFDAIVTMCLPLATLLTATFAADLLSPHHLLPLSQNLSLCLASQG